ncbi:diacylglycerol/lipid kinase family protein [Actinomarinicola tropica]|uniref:YegS/DAGK C-terminal domain-containing protein n=1 Tax=Actinomarinicola tropica TaxID=2789776 RepID=A0A5Q2RHM4_9ACTN|nr:hypothetical protein [Actinomarinicola tropica]QGG95283.1 hypothetical protein GH723_09350 [Actinomarinicola tropica]
MPIRKGEDWGTEAPLPDDAVEVRSDAEARAIVTAALRAGEPPPPLALLGGDLARAVGSTGDPARLRRGTTRHLPLDVGQVDVDGARHWFVAHLVVRRRLWQGRFSAVMNTEYLGDWKLAPRAHPGDGLLDVLDGRLSLDDRLKARSRVGRGEHLPHPGIDVRRVPDLDVTLARPTTVRLDGESVGVGRVLSVRVLPDAVVGII